MVIDYCKRCKYVYLDMFHTLPPMLDKIMFVFMGLSAAPSAWPLFLKIHF